MEEKDINEALNGFFRFYDEKDCGFKETRPAYEKIIGAFAKIGILPEGTTLDDVIEQCKKIDKAEVIRTNGKVKESNIGLQGFLASLKQGYSEEELENDDTAQALYDKYGIKGELPEKASDRLKAINMAIGNLALEALGKAPDKNDENYQSYIEASAFLDLLQQAHIFQDKHVFRHLIL